MKSGTDKKPILRKGVFELGRQDHENELEAVAGGSESSIAQTITDAVRYVASHFSPQTNPMADLPPEYFQWLQEYQRQHGRLPSPEEVMQWRSQNS